VEDCCLKIERAFAVSVSAYKSRDYSRKRAPSRTTIFNSSWTLDGYAPANRPSTRYAPKQTASPPPAPRPRNRPPDPPPLSRIVPKQQSSTPPS
jgi:hypothetical protein